MELKIDRFRITSDQYNFVLHEYGERKNPRTKEVSEGYSLVGFYPRFEHILHKIVELEIKAVEESSVDKIIDAIKKCEKTIKQCLKEYNYQQDRVKEAKDEE